MPVKATVTPKKRHEAVDGKTPTALTIYAQTSMQKKNQLYLAEATVTPGPHFLHSPTLSSVVVTFSICVAADDISM